MTEPIEQPKIPTHLVSPGAVTPMPPIPPPASLPPSDNGKDRLDFLWKIHGYINDYIRFADNKAAFVTASVVVLIGAVVSSGVFDGLGQIPRENWPIHVWCSVGALAFLLLAFLFALWGIKPRLHSTIPKGFIYWGSVLEHKKDTAYATECHTLTADELELNVSRHIFVLAGICNRKYFWVHLAMWTGAIGGMLAGSVLLAAHILLHRK
jgi:hypothetical protein